MTEKPSNFTLVSTGKGDGRVHIFQTEKSKWTTDELSDLANTLKSYVQDEDERRLKELGRYDMLGTRRVNSF